MNHDDLLLRCVSFSKIWIDETSEINVTDLPAEEVLKPMHLIGGTHRFDREIERVAGYPCFADSDGGECD